MWGLWHTTPLRPTKPSNLLTSRIPGVGIPVSKPVCTTRYWQRRDALGSATGWVTLGTATRQKKRRLNYLPLPHPPRYCLAATVATSAFSPSFFSFCGSSFFSSFCFFHFLFLFLLGLFVLTCKGLKDSEVCRQRLTPVPRS